MIKGHGGGNLLPSIKTIIFILIANCAVSVANSGGYDFHDCLNEFYTKEQLVRIDSKNYRLFIVWDKNKTVSLSNVKDFITPSFSCFKNTPYWHNNLSVSIFSQKKYAGYMMDSHIRPYLKNGEWEKAYLAEYSAQESILTISPLVTPQSFTIE